MAASLGLKHLLQGIRGGERKVTMSGKVKTWKPLKDPLPDFIKGISNCQGGMWPADLGEDRVSGRSCLCILQRELAAFLSCLPCQGGLFGDASLLGHPCSMSNHPPMVPLVTPLKTDPLTRLWCHHYFGLAWNFWPRMTLNSWLLLPPPPNAGWKSSPGLHAC